MAIKCGRGYGAFQQPRGGNLASDRVQRRLTAILAADVAGYSRLMGLDEAGTARTLHEHRAAVDPIVASFGGRIVKTTGDEPFLIRPKSAKSSSETHGVETDAADSRPQADGRQSLPVVWQD